MTRTNDPIINAICRSLVSAGVALALLSAPAWSLDDTLTFELQGNVADEQFGGALACHLGLAVIGAPGGGTPSVGAVTIFDPIAGAPLQTLASPDQGTVSAGFGSTVVAIGDVNGDSIEDLAIAAPGSLAVGQVFVYTGSLPAGVSSSPFRSFDGTGTSGRFGRSIANLGDLNGDGVNEIAVSSRGMGTSTDGAIHVIDVSAQATLYVIAGLAGDDLGFSLSSVRDLDGDGIREIVAGAPGASSGRGAVRVYSGISGAQISAVSGNTDGQVFGQAIANVGDLDADGFDDILIGAPSASGAAGAGVGRARLISGGTLTSFPIRALCDLRGTGFGDRFGATVAAIPDITGDSVGDFVVGSPNTPLIVDDEEDDDDEPTIVENRGSVHVYRFSSDRCRAIEVLSGPAPAENKQLGVSISACLFANDAFPDLVVGTRSDLEAKDAGSVVVFNGEPPPPVPAAASFRFRITEDGDLTARIEYDTDPFGNCDMQIFGRTEQSDLVNEVFLLGDGTPQGRVNTFSAEGLPRAAKIEKDKPILHAIVRTTCGSTILDSNIFSRFVNCGLPPALPIDQWQASVEEILTADGASTLLVKERRPKTKRQRMKDRRHKLRKRQRSERRSTSRGR